MLACRCPIINIPTRFSKQPQSASGIGLKSIAPHNSFEGGPNAPPVLWTIGDLPVAATTRSSSFSLFFSSFLFAGPLHPMPSKHEQDGRRLGVVGESQLHSRPPMSYYALPAACHVCKYRLPTPICARLSGQSRTC